MPKKTSAWVGQVERDMKNPNHEHYPIWQFWQKFKAYFVAFGPSKVLDSAPRPLDPHQLHVTPEYVEAVFEVRLKWGKDPDDFQDDNKDFDVKYMPTSGKNETLIRLKEEYRKWSTGSST
ncbi:MAG: hypothetical protein Q9211_001862 [Gyalolechia sp. 1 TL-2023]